MPPGMAEWGLKVEGGTSGFGRNVKARYPPNPGMPPACLFMSGKRSYFRQWMNAPGEAPETARFLSEKYVGFSIAG